MLFSNILTTTLDNFASQEVLRPAVDNSEQVVSNVTSTVQNFFAGINWSEPSWDLFIILFCLLVSLIYGLSIGRDRAVIIILSIYMSLAVIDYAPFLENLIQGTALEDLFIFKLTSFLIVFIILFFFLAQSALLNTMSSRNATRSWWQSFIFSFLQVGLLVSVVLSFLPMSATQNLSEFTQNVFVSESGRFVWIIVPILLMILIRKPRRRPRREIDDYF
ncbi:hypothetical protein KKF32_02930 [Patescibacteria group bacterium]|nr:hypothetical protein [Patescibacteria group bacterium]